MVICLGNIRNLFGKHLGHNSTSLFLSGLASFHFFVPLRVCERCEKARRAIYAESEADHVFSITSMDQLIDLCELMLLCCVDDKYLWWIEMWLCFEQLSSIQLQCSAIE
jgi:hypothetical protein